MLGGRHGLSDFDCFGNSVTRFESGQDTFVASEEVEGLQCFIIAAIDIVNAFGIFPIAVFGSDTWIIETSGDGVHVAGLTIFILHDIAIAAVQNARVSMG